MRGEIIVSEFHATELSTQLATVNMIRIPATEFELLDNVANLFKAMHIRIARV
jgi:hypothetical protein